jgi:hypothetical protein
MLARWIGVPVALLTAIAAGCGGASSTPGPVRGKVTGTLVFVGGPPPGLPRPISGVVTFTGSVGKTTDVTVGPSGAFKM